MSNRLGSVKPKDFIRKLQKVGYVIDHQTGSHVVLYHSNGTRLVVPFHAREMKRGLLMALLKQSGMTPEKYRQL